LTAVESLHADDLAESVKLATENQQEEMVDFATGIVVGEDSPRRPRWNQYPTHSVWSGI
jgi:hypothetical protein